MSFKPGTIVTTNHKTYRTGEKAQVVCSYEGMGGRTSYVVKFDDGTEMAYFAADLTE